MNSLMIFLFGNQNHLKGESYVREANNQWY